MKPNIRHGMKGGHQPLRQADDAIVLDNSHMSVDEQMAWFMEQFKIQNS